MGTFAVGEVSASFVRHALTKYLQDVPDFDRAVPCPRGQHCSVRVKVYSRHPVSVALAAHQEVAVRHRPNLPRFVVAHRRNYCLWRRFQAQGSGGVVGVRAGDRVRVRVWG